MADPLSIVGGLAAGLQLVSMAGKALLATIKLLQDLQEVPGQLAQLLREVDDSISRLCYSCRGGSHIFSNLDPAQEKRLTCIADSLHPVLQEIHNMITPLFPNRQGKRKAINQFWNSIVSLKVEKELSQKLEKLNRLNIEMVRELGVVGLEVQLATNELVAATNTTSAQGFSNLEAQMDSLRREFQTFTISMQEAHTISLEASTLSNDDDEKLNKTAQVEESTWEIVSRSSTSLSGTTIGHQQPSEDKRLSEERAEQMRRYLEGSLGKSAALVPSPLSRRQRPDSNLESVLFSIRTFYTTGNFDPSAPVQKVQFWQDTDLAIYLMKIAKGEVRGSSQSQTRGFRLLKNSTVGSPAIFHEGTATIIIELLSTLSPVNTTTCPFVRDAVLAYINELARTQLHPQHPISLVIATLMKDKGDKNVSLRALTSVVDRLRATLGPAHELTQLATSRLCALLRRSGDYEESLRVANEGVRALRSLLGPISLQERKLLRHVEHVYIDQEDWPAALSVCFDIVGQQHLETPDPDPIFHDDCAVYTMEDIAKICECAGNLALAVAWLKQAKVASVMAWGEGEEAGHIQDKLDELLTQIGSTEAFDRWQAEAVADDIQHDVK
ncbi:uncharacterized protein BKA55DRAFT_693035 [Fusarium redolens]|uniref:Fungal N-terminal domain-containing protein n=1 Tax=Fusarium redolens TaxID=48865 RepID=A0A9P9GMP2_FUSRE|nr:uncharacterized protein BKA55DRAFT_693035 [Fusarium redolens]KAH7240789.1 hypothetical protein BKA55DRAFT_693035 [Fusarium redolens]